MIVPVKDISFNGGDTERYIALCVKNGTVSILTCLGPETSVLVS